MPNALKKSPAPLSACVSILRGVSLSLAATAFGSTAHAGDITVFAAVSLSEVLKEIVASYEDAGHGSVTLSFAASSVLARQIQFGAPADIFLSANADWMAVLEKSKDVQPGTVFDFAGNALVLIAAGDEPPSKAVLTTEQVKERVGDARLAMALVDAVPAGIYAKAALSSLGLWDRLSDQVVQTDSVRSALALVAVGEAPFGVVYATDALAEPRVTVIGAFDALDHPPIRYKGAAISGRHSAYTAEFLGHLQSQDTRAVLKARGFELVPE